MSKLNAYLNDRFAANAEVMSAFAKRKLRLVAIHQRRWRGQMMIKQQAEVKVDGSDVSKSVTEPRWDLLPDEMKTKFNAHEKAVRDVMNIYAETGELPSEGDGEQEESEMIASLLSGGMRLVDSSNIDRVRKLIEPIQRKWREDADSYTDEEGYQNFRDLVKEKVGDETFGLVERLLPEKNNLANKFGLTFYEVPVQFVVDAKTTTPERQAMIVNAIAMLVRGPRVRLAESLQDLMTQLGGRDGETFVPRKVVADGKIRKRTIRGTSIISTAKAVSHFKDSCAYLDVETSESVESVVKAVPTDSGAATALAKSVNDDDRAAESLYCNLESLLKSAMDEDNMVAAAASSIK